MPSTPVEHRWRWRIGAALLILAASALHVAYLINNCPLDLAPDEAHYWDWSRHLDWSYYSKGPLVALLIRGSCELFGPWAEATTGSLMPAIRLPAVLCGALLLAGLYALTSLTLRRESLAFAVVALALTQPIVAAGSSLMTIDAPYLACWTWATVFGYLAVTRDRIGPWIAAGLIVAVGILAKYTMVLFLPSLALYLFLQFGFRISDFGSSDRGDPLSAIRKRMWRRFLLLTAVAALGGVPILIWNAQHDWVTLRHLGGQAGATEPARWRWLGPLTFLGGQAAILLGFWFVVWAAAMWRYRPRSTAARNHRLTQFDTSSSAVSDAHSRSALHYTDTKTQRDRNTGSSLCLCASLVQFENRQQSCEPADSTQSATYLWCLSAPTFFIFLLLSLKSSGQVNWPVAMYVSGGVLAAAWLAARAHRAVWRWATAAAASLGVVAIVIVHYPSLAQPVLLSIAGPPTPRYPLPIRRVDPTARLRGYRTLARAVDQLRDEVRAAGHEPVIAATFWNVPGILAVYCDGHPTVYTLGPALYDRRSQLDFWRPNPLWDPDQFRGRPFVLVGDFTPALLAAFDRIDPPREVRHVEGDAPIALWHIAVGWGYRGFGPIEPRIQGKNF